MKLFDLTGKVAVVTGGGRGIGRAIAVGMAEAGAYVVVVGRNRGPLEESVSVIREAGGEAVACQADVSRTEDVERFVRVALDAFGAIHILVNNAAVSPFARLAQSVTDEGWDELMAVNLRGAFLVARSVGKVMIGQKYGRIINVTSVLGDIGMSRAVPYAPAKAALRSLTQCLAADWGRFGIRVNSLAPGFVETDMNERARTNENFVDAVKNRVTLRRWAKPEDMVGPAIFLAAPASDFVTGTTLFVDGGLLNAWDPAI
jgi:NAD(P)-dependent dehydrogenase (short-subunit alcohol dehydrogenase family)